MVFYKFYNIKDPNELLVRKKSYILTHNRDIKQWESYPDFKQKIHGSNQSLRILLLGRNEFLPKKKFKNFHKIT